MSSHATPTFQPRSILKSSNKRAQRNDSASSMRSPTTVTIQEDMRGSICGVDRSSLGNLRKSLTMKKQMSKAGIQFSDNVDVLRISFMRNSIADNCFWSEDELADFRNEAFMEECGLNPDDFE